MSGDVLAVHRWKDNAALIADVAKLGYLDGHVVDLTYGMGGFWKRWVPVLLTPCDLNPEKVPVLGVCTDFRKTGFDTDQFDSSVFDPPYRLCLSTDTDILTRRGWLRHDQVLIGDEAWSLDHETGEARWAPVVDVNVFPAEPMDVFVADGKNFDVVATAGHRWPVITAKGKRRWKTSSSLSSNDRIVRSAKPLLPAEAVHDDAWVELVAWWWTEGDIAPSSTTYGGVTQSPTVNPEYCERIAACFEKLFGPPVETFPRTGRTSSEMWRWYDERPDKRRFMYSAAIGRQLHAAAPAGVLSPEFLCSLTADQLDLLVETSIDADGSRSKIGQVTLTQSSQDRLDAFGMACHLAGRPVSYRRDGDTWLVNLGSRSMSKPHRNGWRVERRLVEVWCPTVKGTGSWFARSNGRAFFTGNSGTPDRGEFDDRYGIDIPARWQDRMELILEGVVEGLRIAKRYALVKCQDQVCSGQMRWQTDMVTDVAARHGCRKVDRFDLLTSHRPQPPGRRQVHAAHDVASQLLVFDASGFRVPDGRLEIVPGG